MPGRVTAKYHGRAIGNCAVNHTIDVNSVKAAARGRWAEILQAVGGLTAEQCNPRKHQPCPHCGGRDRFRAFNDVAETGGAICNQCHRDGGDGFATLQWLTGKRFPEVLRDLAGFLGVAIDAADNRPINIVAEVARVKRVPVEALIRFGAVAVKQGKKVVARVPMFDAVGKKVSHIDLTPTAKGWYAKGKPAGVFLPGRKPNRGETWIIVEGVKDAAALVGLGYVAAGLPTSSMATKFVELFRGVAVIIVPDLGTAGQRGANLTASRLHGVAASVRIARLPGEIVARAGADVRDILQGTGGEHAVRRAIEFAKDWQPPAPDGAGSEQREIELTLQEHRVVTDVLPALAELGWTLQPQADHLRIYQRGGALVHVVTDASPVAAIDMPDNTRRIRPLPAVLLRERITAAVRLYHDVETAEGFVRRYDRPPEWLVAMLHQRGEYPRDVRPLAGVITAPTMRPDGSILQHPGYDAETGLLVELSGEWPLVPERPTRDDAVRAGGELIDVVRDFPYVGPAHRSGWLAFVLTLLARPGFRGPAPLFLVDANTRGSGKSLAADAAGMIATGQRLPRKTWASDDDEIRKTITATALEALPVVLLDNVAGRLGSPSFDAALTATTWSDRILGQSATTGTLPLTTIWVATGNNIALEADTARRTLLTRLESPEEHPEERTGFAHPDLLAWVSNERRRLAVAGLTILRAYVAAGRPDQNLPPWGSFDAWSNLVRQAIVWAGLADPAETRAIVREADRSVELLGLIHDALEEADAGRGVTTAEIVRLLEPHSRTDASDPYPILRAAVAEICGSKIDARRLGIELRKHLGRVWKGRRLEREDDSHGKVARWRVVDLRGPAGPAGTFSPSNAGDPHTASPDVAEMHAYQAMPERPEISPHIPALPARLCPCCRSSVHLLAGASGRLWCRECEVEVVTP